MPAETAKVTVDRVREAIFPVRDPEIGFSVLELGLIYDIVLANEARMWRQDDFDLADVPRRPDDSLTVHEAVRRSRASRTSRWNWCGSRPGTPR